MPHPLLVGIIFAGLVLIGALVFISLNRDRRQRIAVIFAYGALLILLLGVFYFMDALQTAPPQTFWLVIAACVVIPLGLYLGIALSAPKEKAVDKKAVDKVQKPTPEPSVPPGVGAVPRPPADPEPTPDPEPEPTPTPEPEPTPDPDPADTADATPTPISSLDEFEDCFAKAEALKEQGQNTAAAKLYEECVLHTQDIALINKALFAAMNAYFKDGMKDDVRRLALLLEDVSIMTDAQSKKLAAILKML